MSIFEHVALKFNNKLKIFFPLFLCLRIFHGHNPYKDHDDISYLHHMVVMTAEPAASPTVPSSRDALPNFTVKQFIDSSDFTKQQVWIY